MLLKFVYCCLVDNDIPIVNNINVINHQKD
jgi:hypothetical protein